MKLSLRYFALGAAIAAVGAMNAQTPTVTQKWLSHQLIADGFVSGDVRCGNGVNGTAYISNGKSIMTFDGTAVKTLYTSEGSLNRGFAVDEAGNVAIFAGWPSSATSWQNFKLIKADGTATDITIDKPTESAWASVRTDLIGRATGDFFSEEGGVFYLTSNQQEYPIPVWIANGEPQTLEYSTDISFGACNNMAYAQPRLPMAELDPAGNMMTAFYIATGNMAQIGYVNDADEAEYFAWPNADCLPETWYTKNDEGVANITRGQNGFDVFELGGETYAVHHFGATNWTSDFAIWNVNTGEVIFHTNYAETENGDKTGNGCGLFARKVNDNTVELFQIYTNATNKEKSFAALYEITLPQEPAKSVYMAGKFQNWDPANPVEFTLNEDGKYTYEFTQTGGGVKISTAKGTWDEFNAGILGVDGGAIATGNTYTLVPGNTSDIAIEKGQYTFTIDLTAMTLTVTGEATFEAPELYIRGELNEWGTSEATKMATTGEIDENGNVTYTWSADALEGLYKIGTSDWSVSLGGHATGAGTFELERGGMDNNLSANLKHVNMTLTYPTDITKAPTLTVAGFVTAERKAFAYNVKGEALENDQYKVTFTSTAAAEEAEVVLKDENGQTAGNFTLTGVVKGENTITVDLADLAEGKYTWAVRILSTLDNETGAIAYEAPGSWQGEDNTTGGVVFIRDANEDAFGYVVVGHGRARGFAVFTPEGELVGDKLYHVGYEKFTASNGSSTTRGDALRGYAVFADWADKSSGYWRIDPLNPETEPVNMLMVEGATQDKNGAVTYNGVQTGSGSCTVAFQGEGENTKMFAYDEDIYGNTIVRYDLGTADMITAAPSLVIAPASQFGSLNVDVEGVENGFFVSQGRANNWGGIPNLIYFDNEGNKVWDSASIQDFAADCSSGFAVSTDGRMAAIVRYNSMDIIVYALGYDEYNEPTFTELFTIPMVGKYVTANPWTQIVFDAGNNLHVFDRRNGGYKVYVMPYSSQSYTPAKAEYTITKSSGIESITVDGAEAPVQYFNLQGIAVDAENMTPGVYVRRQGNNASKVVIK